MPSTKVTPPQLASLEPQGKLLLRAIANTPQLGAEAARAAAIWWQAEREPDELLIAFLVRRQVLPSTAVRQLELMEKGYVTGIDAATLLGPEGARQLRNRPTSATLPPAPAPVRRPAPSSVDLRSQTETAQVPSQASTRPLPRREAAAPPQVGSTLGKCLLTERVGQGASGIVYRALHQSLNIPVAVKVLQLAALERDGSVRQQLRTEARLLAQLNHPHIVRVWDFEDDADYPYLVMEYIEGLSLAELIQQSGQLRWDRALQLMTQIAQGLGAAQKLGIVHRDIKPANILLARDGTPKLADLGLAVVVGDDAIAHATGAATQSSGMAGTAAYMSPEQARGAASIDHRSDIYGLGATFYHAVTGRMPFTGRSRMEVMLKHVKEQPPAPQSLVPDLPTEMADLLLNMMAKEPAARLQSYDEVLAALGRVGTTGLAAADASAAAAQTKSRPSIWKTMLGSLGRSNGDELREGDDAPRS